MRAPDFWRRDGLLPALLAPLGDLFDLGGRLRRAFGTAENCGVPVICVGNLVAGGAGKTPFAIALCRHLQERGVSNVHFLSRGYGGSIAGPHRVDPAADTARTVGDEPLLLAAHAPAWIARRRAAGAKAAVSAGARLIIMDDGFQNPGLRKNVSILIFDGGQGIGNGRVMPAGPLRERLEDGLKRADLAVIIGPDETGLRQRLSSLPVLECLIEPGPEAAGLAGKRLLAFAGIGRPEKFFATLEGIGGEIVARRPFPDHHPYAREEIMELLKAAEQLGALPITTEKDAMRIEPSLRKGIGILSIRLNLGQVAELDRIMAKVLPA